MAHHRSVPRRVADTRGETLLLDENEFADAKKMKLIDLETANRAWEESQKILSDAALGLWPPKCVREWNLERALTMLGSDL